MLRYVNALAFAWEQTGDERYRERAYSLPRPGSGRIPRRCAGHGRGMAQSGHRVADDDPHLPDRHLSLDAWLTRAIEAHGAILYWPDVWVRKGNHALSQAIALLDARCHLARAGWQRRAAARIGILARLGNPPAGASAEQATKYDRYDYYRFSVAIELLGACGMPPRRVLDPRRTHPGLPGPRPTRPDGHLETIGDTDDVPLRPIAGTATEYTASGCAVGQPPDRTVAIYDAGYAFVRTRWGEERPFGDETFVSLRFQRGHRSHGHDDSGGVTLYGAGGKLLVDPGYGDQNSSRWHRFFISLGGAQRGGARRGRDRAPRGSAAS